MLNSADDRTPPGAAHDRRIEIRMAFPERVRYEKGQPVRERGPDPNRVFGLLHPEVARALQDHYGPHTEVTFAVGRTPDVRLTGRFPEKPGDVKERVQETLALALEGLGEVTE